MKNEKNSGESNKKEPLNVQSAEHLADSPSEQEIVDVANHDRLTRLLKINQTLVSLGWNENDDVFYKNDLKCWWCGKNSVYTMEIRPNEPNIHYSQKLEFICRECFFGQSSKENLDEVRNN